MATTFPTLQVLVKAFEEGVTLDSPTVKATAPPLLDAALKALPPDEKTMLVQLSIFPATFTASDAAAVLLLSPPVVQKQLASFIAQSLIIPHPAKSATNTTPNPAQQTYCFPLPLTDALIAARSTHLTPDESNSIIQRYLRHHGSSAAALATAVTSGGAATATTTAASISALSHNLPNFERALLLLLSPLAKDESEEALEALLSAVDAGREPTPPLSAGASKFWARCDGAFGNLPQRLADAIIGLAFIEQLAGQPQLAKTFVGLMITVFKAKNSNIAGDKDKSAALGRLLACHGRLLIDCGKYRQALEVLGQAKDLLTAGLGQSDVVTQQCCVSLAQVMYSLDEVDAAMEEVGSALDILDGMLAAAAGKPDESLVTDVYAGAAELRAMCMRAVGSSSLEEVAEIVERALAERSKVLGPQHLQVSRSLLSWSAVQLDLGDLEGAEASARGALSIRHATYTVGASTDVAEAIIALGDVLGRQGLVSSSTETCAKARRVYRDGINMLEELHGPRHPLAGAAQQCLGDLLLEADDLAGAERCYLMALQTKEELFGQDKPQVESSLAALGLVSHRLQRHEAARDCYSRALAIRQAVYGPDHMQTDVALRNLGSVLLDMGITAEAQDTFNKALAIEERELGPKDPLVARTLTWLEEVYRRQGNTAQADACAARAAAILADATPPPAS